MHVDGRHQILLGNVLKDVDRARRSLKEIEDILQNDQNLCLIDQTASAKKQSATTKAELKKKITLLIAEIKSTKKKIDAAVPSAKELLRSKSLESQNDALADQVESIFELIVALSSSQPVPDDYLQAISKCESHNMSFNSQMKKLSFGCSRNI